MCSVVPVWSIVCTLLLLVTGCFSSCVKMLSSRSVLVCYVVSPRGIVQLISVKAVHVVCFV